MIKQKFRELALKYHPDAHFEKKLSQREIREIEEQFHLIKEAYDVLSCEY